MSAAIWAEPPMSRDERAAEYADRTAVEKLGAWPPCECPEHRPDTKTEDR